MGCFTREQESKTFQLLMLLDSKDTSPFKGLSRLLMCYDIKHCYIMFQLNINSKGGGEPYNSLII